MTTLQPLLLYMHESFILFAKEKVMSEEENPLITLVVYLFIAGVIGGIFKLFGLMYEWYLTNTSEGIAQQLYSYDPKNLARVTEEAYDKGMLTDEMLQQASSRRVEMKSKGHVSSSYYEFWAVLEFAKGDKRAAATLLERAHKRPDFNGFVSSLGQSWLRSKGVMRHDDRVAATYSSSNFNYWYLLPYLLFACAGFALMAILPIDSFGFYMFLRVLLFVGFLSVLFLGLDFLKEMASFIVTIIGAWLWNPFFINELDKSVWVVLDLIAAGLFIYWGLAIQLSIKKDEKLIAEQSLRQTK